MNALCVSLVMNVLNCSMLVFCLIFEVGHFPSGFGLQWGTLFHPDQLWWYCRNRTNLAGKL